MDRNGRNEEKEIRTRIDSVSARIEPVESMPPSKDYYKTLGVPKGASKDEIKRAFRRLAKQYHPDMQRGDKKAAEEKFKQISEAYEVLMDEEKRSRYDSVGKADPTDLFGEGGFTWSNFTRSSDVEDIFGDDVFRQFFGDRFSGYRTPEAFGSEMRERRPKDTTADVWLDIEDVYCEKKVKLNVKRSVRCTTCRGTGSRYGSARCPTCKGSGQVRESYRGKGMERFIQIAVCPTCNGTGRHVSDPCPACDGAGIVSEKTVIKLAIPAGLRDGLKIRLRGKGNEGETSAGDLYVTFRIRPHPFFKMDEDHLIITKEISFSEAALGTELHVKTPDGRAVLLRVPEGTHSGTKLRIPSRGFPRKEGERGDLLVQVNVRTPQHLTEEERELFKRLAELERSR
jgi:molecular chaperone DnaJ